METVQGGIFQEGLRARKQLIKLPKGGKKKKGRKKKKESLFIKICHKPVKVKTESDLY